MVMGKKSFTIDRDRNWANSCPFPRNSLLKYVLDQLCPWFRTHVTQPSCPSDPDPQSRPPNFDSEQTLIGYCKLLLTFLVVILISVEWVVYNKFQLAMGVMFLA